MKQAEDTITKELPLPTPGEPMPGTARPEGLTLVYLEQVDELPQVRTDSGLDDASLDELGDSIMADGLLQLPLLRHSPGGLRYTVVAGHRRIAAMRRKGFQSFYAIVGNADDKKAFRMQLAENIQREQLSLKETAAAVRKLYEEGNGVEEIGAIVKKSKAWVSKHLAVSCEDFSYTARSMLEHGECEDLEILNGINQLDKLGQHNTIHNLRTSDEPITRDKVRELVAQAKEAKKAQKEAKPKNKATPQETAQQKAEREAREAEEKAMREWLETCLQAEAADSQEQAQEQAHALAKALSAEAGSYMHRIYSRAWRIGEKLHNEQKNLNPAYVVTGGDFMTNRELAAYTLGLEGTRLTPMYMLERVALMACLRKQAEQDDDQDESDSE